MLFLVHLRFFFLGFCNSTSICSCWRASGMSDVPCLSCSLPVGGSWFIITGFEFVAQVDALWPTACPGRWVDVWGPSTFGTRCLAPCVHDSPSSLEFLYVLSTTVRCPANSSGKEEMLLCKIFSTVWVFTKGVLLRLKLLSCTYLLCTFQCSYMKSQISV